MRVTEADIGKIVLVQDSTPQPPAHHTRKLAEWNHRNYSGCLVKLYPSYRDESVLVADVLVKDLGYMTLTRSGVSLDRVTLAPHQD